MKRKPTTQSTPSTIQNPALPPVSSFASVVAAMASSFPRTKRAFRHTSDQTPTSNHKPFLPATIQTSLLNVGMRIRKAVPEGYKTSPKPPCPHSDDDGSLRAAGSSRRSCNPIGLIPYCGILKTGNLEQEDHENDVPPLDYGLGDSDFPSSQESTISETSAGGGFDALPLLVNSHKRLYEEDDEASPFVHPDPLRSNPITGALALRDIALRPMLQPKTRKPMAGGERMLKEEPEVEVMDVDDFGDAAFLCFEDMIGDEDF